MTTKTNPIKSLWIMATMLLAILPAFSQEIGTVRVHELRIEHMKAPALLDITQPRLSWKIEATDPTAQNLHQTAYQILVASTPEQLTSNTGDLWDSGLVTSSQSILIPYQGSPLTSRQVCYWKVRIHDNQGNVSAWSDTARWEMALLNASDWSGSQWIGLGTDTRTSPFSARERNSANLRSHPSPLLRKEINIQKTIKKARAYVSGIGYSEFYVNGQKISDHVLDPGQTNYEKNTLYVIHDITENLTTGNNALGAWLGNGFYGQNLGFNPNLGYGRPSLRAKIFIEYTDGTTQTVVTDTSWRATIGPIVFDNIYWGESYDARLEIPGWAEPGLNTSTWQNAVTLPAPCPDDKLRAQLIPPIKEIERLAPVSVRQVAADTYQVDFGKNIAGWFELKLNQNRGDVITIFPSEILNKGSGRSQQTTRASGRSFEGFYICKGNGPETYTPRFAYTGFQYLEITGLSEPPDAESLSAIFVRTALEKTGSFESSNAMLNKQYEAAMLTLEGNWHSIPEDCPQREKCGWLGDVHVSIDISLYNYDMARFATKFIEDTTDSLRIGAAGIGPVPTFVAPGRRFINVATIDWGVAYIIVPWNTYLHTGDAEAFRPYYANFKNFIDYYKTFKNEQGTIDNGLGDWCPPRWDRVNAPQFMETHPYISGTAFYYQALELIGKMAVKMDDPAYAQWCAEEALRTRDAFDASFLRPIEGSSLSHYGSQTATVMALKFGMVPDDQIQPRVDGLLFDIIEEHEGHHACGIFGLRHLYTVLADNSQDELVYQMLTDTTFPGPAYVMSQGFTTWPERRFEWDKVRFSNSFNHPMNGGFVAFMHESLGGIQPDEQAAGFKHFRLKPYLTNQLDWVKTHVESPYGTIRSEWKNEGSEFTWEVEVPVNTTATVFIPNGTEWTEREIGSGIHRFTNEPGPAPIAHWKLDEGSGTTAADTSGSRSDGALEGQSPTSPMWATDAIRGTHLALNGTNQRIATPFTYALSNTEDFTWAWWAKSDLPPTNVSQSGAIMVGNRHTPAGSETFEFIKFTPTEAQFANTDTVSNIENYRYENIPQGGWNHYAMVKRGSSYTWFKNGIEQGFSSNGSASPPPKTITYNESTLLPFFIGGDSAGNANEHFRGGIDDVVLYRRALSKLDVENLLLGIYDPTISMIRLGSPADLASGETWSDGLPPHPDTRYIIPPTGILRSPAGTSSFPGIALTVLPGGTFQVLGIEENGELTTVNQLILSGGSSFSQGAFSELAAGLGNGATHAIGGTITTSGHTRFLSYRTPSSNSISASLKVLSRISGSGRIQAFDQPANGLGTITISNPQNTFLGTWEIATGSSLIFDNPGAVGTADIEVMQAASLEIKGNWSTQASLTVADATDTRVNFGNHGWKVSSLLISGTPVPNGVYTAAELNNLSTTPIFTGLGSITVGAGLPDGPIAHWRLDGGSSDNTAIDSSGSGHSGTLTGGASFIVDATRGPVISLDGETGRVTTPYTYTLSSTDNFTWTWWANKQSPDGTDNNAIMVGNRYRNAGSGTLEFIKMTPTRGEFRSSTAENYDYQNITNDGWHHYAMVKSGTEYRWYVNGVFEQRTPAGPINYSETLPLPFHIGGDDDNTTPGGREGEHFLGLIDDVILYDRALAPLEVEATRNGLYSDLPTTHLQAYRRLYFGTTANTGTSANDHDANSDGENNLLEFATGQNPTAGTSAETSATRLGENVQFRYTRSIAALSDGIEFEVEWSTSLLPNTWQTTGITDVVDQTRPQTSGMQHRIATIPTGTSSRSFVRLKVTAP